MKTILKNINYLTPFILTSLLIYGLTLLNHINCYIPILILSIIIISTHFITLFITVIEKYNKNFFNDTEIINNKKDTLIKNIFNIFLGIIYIISDIILIMSLAYIIFIIAIKINLILINLLFVLFFINVIHLKIQFYLSILK